jgi:hypothetical protein
MKIIRHRTALTSSHSRVDRVMLNAMRSNPEYVAISPMTLACPRCKAKPGKACVVIKDSLELIHLERIEAAITLDEVAKKAS